MCVVVEEEGKKKTFPFLSLSQKLSASFEEKKKSVRLRIPQNRVARFGAGWRNDPYVRVRLFVLSVTRSLQSADTKEKGKWSSTCLCVSV